MKPPLRRAGKRDQRAVHSVRFPKKVTVRIDEIARREQRLVSNVVRMLVSLGLEVYDQLAGHLDNEAATVNAIGAVASRVVEESREVVGAV